MSGLRIIGGEARGRVLKTFPVEDLSVRPMLGRIKKSLFDILAPRLPGARFLDLYAGTGNVGFEALSRGAGESIFVEMSPRSIRLIEENLKMLGWERRARIVKADVLQGLRGLPARSFDIVFMGPPYVDQQKRPLYLTGKTLNLVLEADLLAPDGLIVSQHSEREPVTAPEGLENFRREKYGDTIINFYRKKTHAAEAH